MKHYETQTETVEREVVVRVTCDRCGQDIPRLAGGYAEREVEIHYAAGASYPSGGHLRGWQVEDLCDDCTSALRELLEAHGFSVTRYAIDW